MFLQRASAQPASLWRGRRRADRGVAAICCGRKREEVRRDIEARGHGKRPPVGGGPSGGIPFVERVVLLEGEFPRRRYARPRVGAVVGIGAQLARTGKRGKLEGIARLRLEAGGIERWHGRNGVFRLSPPPVYRHASRFSAFRRSTCRRTKAQVLGRCTGAPWIQAQSGARRRGGGFGVAFWFLDRCRGPLLENEVTNGSGYNKQCRSGCLDDAGFSEILRDTAAMFQTEASDDVASERPVCRHAPR